jgi:hypothetical protein
LYYVCSFKKFLKKFFRVPCPITSRYEIEDVASVGYGKVVIGNRGRARVAMNEDEDDGDYEDAGDSGDGRRRLDEDNHRTCP